MDSSGQCRKSQTFWTVSFSELKPTDSLVLHFLGPLRDWPLSLKGQAHKVESRLVESLKNKCGTGHYGLILTIKEVQSTYSPFSFVLFFSRTKSVNTNDHVNTRTCLPHLREVGCQKSVNANEMSRLNRQGPKERSLRRNFTCHYFQPIARYQYSVNENAVFT